MINTAIGIDYPPQMRKSIINGKDPSICVVNLSVPSIMMNENQQKVEVLLDEKSYFTYYCTQTPSNPEVCASSDGDPIT